MSELVVDASTIVEYLMPTLPGRDLAGSLRRHGYLAVPEVCDLEVASAVRSAQLQKRISRETADESIDLYLDLPLERYSHTPMMREIFSLRARATPYDASYLVLAYRLGVPLLTADRRLRSTAAELGIQTAG